MRNFTDKFSRATTPTKNYRTSTPTNPHRKTRKFAARCENGRVFVRIHTPTIKKISLKGDER